MTTTVRCWRLLALLAATACAVVGLGHGLDWSPDYTDRLRDDAFYEFTWAANLAAGRGPMVSDGVTTSGVQLLWSLCLVPLAYGFGAAALPLLAPWLGLVLHLAAALLLVRSGRDRLAAICAGLCWLGHPLLLRECQNGQETALAALMLLLLWRARRASTTRFCTLAVLTSLARSDLFFAVAALSLLRHGRAWWCGLLLPLLIALLHLLLNAALGGGFTPDSAAPMAWLWHQNFAALAPTAAELAARWWWYLRPVLFGGPWSLLSSAGSALCLFGLLRPWWPRRWRLLPIVVVAAAWLLGARDVVVAGGAALLLAVLPATGPRRAPPHLLAMFVGAAAVIVVHWALRWYPRDYYLGPLVVVAMVALLHYGRLRWLLVVFVLAQLAEVTSLRPEPLAGQEAMALAGRHLHQVLPPGERVGCFNSGLLTFGAYVLRAGEPAQRAVVNLDGVVDARAFAALQRGRLAAWLDDEQVRFVLDNPVQFASDPRVPHANGHWLAPDFDAARDLRELARFVVPAVAVDRPGTDGFRLYWRVGRGPVPAMPARARELGSWRAGRCVLWPARAGQVLELELAGGERRALLRVDCDTVVVAAIAAMPRATGRLFVAGSEVPLLTLTR